MILRRKIGLIIVCLLVNAAGHAAILPHVWKSFTIKNATPIKEGISIIEAIRYGEVALPGKSIPISQDFILSYGKPVGAGAFYRVGFRCQNIEQMIPSDDMIYVIVDWQSGLVDMARGQCTVRGKIYIPRWSGESYGSTITLVPRPA